MDTRYGRALRLAIQNRDIIPFIGVYDVFSATLAARYYDALFISGFGFAASYYGLPDIGFIAWSDMLNFVQRVRTVLPHHHLLVDIDDGYSDTEVACHVVSMLETVGASGVVLEDQRRPRRCGHVDGKQLMDLSEYLVKLRKVLEVRRELIVIARTDATDSDEIARRVEAFSYAGADAVLVDGLRDLGLIKALKNRVGRPFTFNQIAGGKSPLCSLEDLKEVGVSLVIYSTPCLFAAQGAVDNAIKSLKDFDGSLKDSGSVLGLRDCAVVLNDNLARRDTKDQESEIRPAQSYEEFGIEVLTTTV